MRSPVARQGYPYIALSLLAVGLFIWAGRPLGWFFWALVTLFVTAFFRDPERVAPRGEGLILAPADGKVILVEEAEEPFFIKARGVKVSIFMSVFNCHVNRVPVTGRIEDRVYRPGRFFAAHQDRASRQNEQNALLLVSGDRQAYCVVQIAGLIARRIVCWVRRGQEMKQGERFGLIQFGSRVDLYLPPGCRIKVRRGDKVKAGLSIIGEKA
jgi:phosphatidylserine decarboxylase